MGNLQVSSNQPLQGLTPPTQLRPPVKPAATSPAAPVTPGTLAAPDRLHQQMRGGTAPQVSLIEAPVTDIRNGLARLQTLMKTADQQTLSAYAVQIETNPQGQITGYRLNGQPASAAQVQQHLLPAASFLHQELVKTQQQVDQEYGRFLQQINQQLPQMQPLEQNAVRIQLQAIGVVYKGFLERIQQVDGLIR
jgi:hypothetical protein